MKYLACTASQYTESFTYKTWSFHELATSTDPRGKVTTYSHDLRGRVTQVADLLSSLTKFTYNSQGLVTHLTDPANNITQFSYSLTDLSAVTDPLGRTTAFFTDPLGRVVQTTNPLGHRSTTSYGRTPCHHRTPKASARRSQGVCESSGLRRARSGVSHQCA